MLSRVHTVALRLLDVCHVQGGAVYCAKNGISASDSLLAENPIKAWAIHTPTLRRRSRLWTPDTIQSVAYQGMYLMVPVYLLWEWSCQLSVQG